MLARRIRPFFVPFLLLLMPGCAGHRIIGGGKATLTLNRGDLKELREAFRTATEKTVSLPTHGEIACEEYRCFLPVKGPAPVYENEALVGRKQVSGKLAFAPSVPAFLLARSDEAAERDKDFSQAAPTGQASCNSRHCVLDFTFPANGMVTLDLTGETLTWK